MWDQRLELGTTPVVRCPLCFQFSVFSLLPIHLTIYIFACGAQTQENDWWETLLGQENYT